MPRKEKSKIQEETSRIRDIADDIGAMLLSDEMLTSHVSNFIPTGATLLDLALGGGWAIRRIVNIVGDPSVGKSLLAAEAAVHARRKYNAVVIYDDAECTFEAERAVVYGINPEEIIYRRSETIEDFFETIIKLLEKKNFPEPLIYILDSLDSLPSKEELTKKMDEGSYGTSKAKKMSEGLRKVARLISERDVCLIIVSQTRQKIGVLFGEKTDISGGNALKFYASQRIKLAQLEKLRDKNKTTYGVAIKVKVIKNKVADPFKEIEFDILFEIGVDDVGSCVQYYGEHVGYEWNDQKFKGKASMIEYIEHENLEEELRERVKKLWAEEIKIESGRKKKWLPEESQKQ